MHSACFAVHLNLAGYSHFGVPCHTIYPASWWLFHLPTAGCSCVHEQPADHRIKPLHAKLHCTTRFTLARLARRSVFSYVWYNTSWLR